MRISEWLNYRRCLVSDTVFYIFVWADITYKKKRVFHCPTHIYIFGCDDIRLLTSHGGINVLF
jgi:F420-dependent methylenetetrahydromethanopterin dehydrogenase